MTLSFDIALLISLATITALVTIYFTLLQRLGPSGESKLTTYLEPAAEKRPAKKRKQVSETASVAEQPTVREGEEKVCPHYVGYLTTLPKGSPFPDECFGCRNVIQCLRIEPTKVIESFYIAEEAK